MLEVVLRRLRPSPTELTGNGPLVPWVRFRVLLTVWALTGLLMVAFALRVLRQLSRDGLTLVPVQACPSSVVRVLVSGRARSDPCLLAPIVSVVIIVRTGPLLVSVRLQLPSRNRLLFLECVQLLLCLLNVR